MPDERKSEEPGFTGMARDFTDRFGELIERMSATARSGTQDITAQWRAVLDSGAAMSSMPLRQLNAMVLGIRNQRDQIAAMQNQLAAFDAQLEALDTALRPVLEWAQQWSDAQERVLGYARRATRRPGE